MQSEVSELGSFPASPSNSGGYYSLEVYFYSFSMRSVNTKYRIICNALRISIGDADSIMVIIMTIIMVIKKC